MISGSGRSVACEIGKSARRHSVVSEISFAGVGGGVIHLDKIYILDKGLQGRRALSCMSSGLIGILPILQEHFASPLSSGQCL